MELRFLTPAVVSLVMSLLLAATARARHRASNGSDTYVFVPSAAYLMIFLGFFFMAVPLWPGLAGDLGVVRFFWMFSPFWLLAFAASAYLFAYRIVITADTLIIGAFRKLVVPLADIVDTDLVEGTNSGELVLYVRGGRRFRVSSLVGDRDDLEGNIRTRMAGPPGGGSDCAEKLSDRKIRVRGARNANVITFVGIALCVVVGLVVYLYEAKGWWR